MTKKKDPKDLKKVGRKTKYKEEYCQELIDFMAQGYSFEAFAGHVHTCRSTIYKWVEDYPKFSDAKKLAFAENQKFWERVGLEGLFMGGKDNPFNSTVWVFNMKNRFNWTDKRESKVDATVTSYEKLIEDTYKDDEE